jgi:hypothetical protein
MHVACFRELTVAKDTESETAEFEVPDGSKAVRIYYLNWRKEMAWRTITPLSIWWGTNEWHETPQNFLRAWDHAKGPEPEKAVRDFALLDVQSVMKAEFEDGKLITGEED